MNLVILADDAFMFLVSWEFMSLSSWALVMAHHENAENRRAGYIYIMMASFGTLALLLAFGLLAGPNGNYAFADMADVARPDWVPGLVLVLVLLGAGSKAGLVPLHVWLPLAHPAAPSHVSASDERRHDQGRGLRLRAHRIRSDGLAGMVVEHRGAGRRAASRAVLGVLSAMHAARSQAAARLQHHREHRHRLHRPWAGARLQGQRHDGRRRARVHGGAAACDSTIRCSRACCSSAPAPCCTATGERDIEKLGGLIHPMPQTAFLVARRLPRHLGAAAAQRVRIRMADLSGHPARALICRSGASS